MALVQRRCALGDKTRNLEAMASAMDTVNADLYVFCEMGLTGYMVRDGVVRLAEPKNGNVVRDLIRMADHRGAHMIVGLATVDLEAGGRLYNSSVLIGGGGALFYDKIHLANFGPFEEGLYFTPGRNPVVAKVGGVGIGLGICYDAFFPSLARDCAQEGADIMVYISASPFTSRASFERVLPARAVENACYVAYVNNVGSQLNQVFFGGSRAIDPMGADVARLPLFEEGVATFDIDREFIAQSRRGRPTLRDEVIT